jgi:hypothetical protein
MTHDEINVDAAKRWLPNSMRSPLSIVQRQSRIPAGGCGGRLR